ncbi:unnamed protein product [marine sediment metagenome]|uniref:Uncharacterized protein n=1 Tax=marine sediment metagenome TaxID=412755 RepID=X1GFT2_9ZZZZ
MKFYSSSHLHKVYKHKSNKSFLLKNNQHPYKIDDKIKEAQSPQKNGSDKGKYFYDVLSSSEDSLRGQVQDEMKGGDEDENDE